MFASMPSFISNKFMDKYPSNEVLNKNYKNNKYKMFNLDTIIEEGLLYLDVKTGNIVEIKPTPNRIQNYKKPEFYSV